MKYKNYVALVYGSDHTITYVTDSDNISRIAKWEANKPAKAFTKTGAENLVFGLRCNGYPAVIVTHPDYDVPMNRVEDDE